MFLPERKFIGIVDDEEELAFLFKDALSGNGFVVNAFTDPQVALDSISSGHLNYRLVLSDIRMPAIDGVELVRKIHEKDKSIRLILMSAYEQSSIPESVGYEFIQKPIHMEKLKEIVFGIAQATNIRQR